MGEKMLPFDNNPICPKCNVQHVTKPVYCKGGRWLTLGRWIPLPCRINAIEHLHYECYFCGIWSVRVCADVRERL